MLLERRDVLGPAVGIARVVERVHADEDVAAREHLGPRQRERQEDRVARRHVCDRDFRAVGRDVAVLRHVRASLVSADPPNVRRSMSTIT